jgi:hypothetical protein
MHLQRESSRHHVLEMSMKKAKTKTKVLRVSFTIETDPQLEKKIAQRAAEWGVEAVTVRAALMRQAYYLAADSKELDWCGCRDCAWNLLGADLPDHPLNGVLAR